MIRHRIEYKVSWGDTFPAGIVFYPRFHQRMDQAAHEWLKGIGLPASERKQIGEGVRNKVFKLRHEFKRNGELVATGHEIRAWTDFTEEKPREIPISEDVRERWKRGKSHEQNKRQLAHPYCGQDGRRVGLHRGHTGLYHEGMRFGSEYVPHVPVCD